MKKLLAFCLLITCVCPQLARAQTYIGGPIWGDSTLLLSGSPYIVTSDIKVGTSPGYDLNQV
jgi:hypothetical protein